MKRGLTKDEAPFPIVAKVGPYIVEDPVPVKNYYWCSCGMSKSQPFCDKSHVGSSFRPLNFQLDEKVPKVYMCGCKLSSTKPFCDGQTCKRILMGESIAEM